MRRKFDLDIITKALVAIGVIALAGLTLFLLVPQKPDLIPAVVPVLLGLLAVVVYHFFPRKNQEGG